MFPLGTIVSLAGQAASGIMSAVNNKRMEREQHAEYARQQVEYNARANENPMSRTDSQAALQGYDKSAEKQVEVARNAAKIAGATPEYSLGVQKAAQEGRGNVIGGIYANASARTDAALDAAERSRQMKAAADLARMDKRNETYANLAANASNAFGSIIDGYQENGNESLNQSHIIAGANASVEKLNNEALSPTNREALSPKPVSLDDIRNEGMKRLKTQL